MVLGSKINRLIIAATATAIAVYGTRLLTAQYLNEIIHFIWGSFSSSDEVLERSLQVFHGSQIIVGLVVFALIMFIRMPRKSSTTST
ncbi:hypothetical protein R50073_00920 [Maricurvus nonylphenolicus]